MSQISHIKYKDIIEAGRFDADFFKPEYLALEKRTESKDFILFENLGLQVDASAFYPSIEPFYNTGNIPFLRVANVDRSIKYDEAVTLPNSVLDEYKTLKLGKPGDLIITKGGSVARIGYVDRECALSRDLIFINTSKLNQQETKFIYFYLLSDFANKLLIKSASLTSQPHLTIGLVKKLPLYFPEKYIRDKIASFFDLSVEKNNKSKQLYQEAEDLLLTELGLKNHTISHTLTFSTTKKAVDDAGRYDADYFQPKYDELIEKIENYKGGWDYVENLFKQNLSVAKTDSETCNYVEIGDINISNGEIIPNEIFVSDLPANGKRVLKKNDLLISKVRPYRGAVSFIDFDCENLIGSGAFTILQEKSDYKKEVLMVFLKTECIKDLLLRYNCGTSYPVIKDDTILKLKLPLINPQLQKEISDKIKESFKLRNESKELLEQAKKMVEDEIEKE